MTHLENIQKLMILRGITLSSAESCTGGLVSAAITSIGGSSGYFLGGVVSYHENVKMNLLNVSKSAIDAYGVVSVEVAQQMAIGVKKSLGSDWSISTTGIAGPGGGSVQNPVGTVCFCIAGPAGYIQRKKIWIDKKNREEIQKAATNVAIEMLWESLNF